MTLTALSLPMTSVFAEGFAKGDVDMDGVITGRDAAIVSQYADGTLKLDLNNEQLALADMNGDGTVDTEDAALIAENQEYKFGDINEDGRVEIPDCTTVLRMVLIKKIDPEIDFGEKEIQADIDLDGDIDVYDAYCILEYYRKQCVGLPCFEENKFYITITPEIERSFLEDDFYVLRHPEANIKTLQELYDLQWNISDYMDVDNDKQVTVSDATAVLQIYAENAADTGIYKASVDTNEKADINLDGKIDITDATLILKAYAMNAAGLL